LDDKPKPVIQAPTDAIVRMTKTTICGTDLDILNGEVPIAVDGQTLGHEGVGVIEDIGENVSNFKAGDRVLISCITSCGQCENCKKGLYSHCENGGGWILGNLIDGTQAEYVRIPFADTSLYAIPEGADEESLVMLSDIFPTGFECGVMNGQVKPGDTVAIIGAGPIGLAALLASQFYSPSQIIVVDNDDNRLETAKKFGATLVLHNDLGNAAEKIMALTNNRGVDVAMEAIGTPASFDICQSTVAVGGHIAVIGVHSQPVQLNLERLWAQNITLTTRLVDTISTPMLMRTVISGKLDPKPLITHRFTLDNVMQAYDTFENAAQEHAIKVLITSD
jgi:alcohol dehydrogenase